MAERIELGVALRIDEIRNLKANDLTRALNVGGADRFTRAIADLNVAVQNLNRSSEVAQNSLDLVSRSIDTIGGNREGRRNILETAQALQNLQTIAQDVADNNFDFDNLKRSLAEVRRDIGLVQRDAQRRLARVGGDTPEASALRSQLQQITELRSNVDATLQQALTQAVREQTRIVEKAAQEEIRIQEEVQRSVADRRIRAIQERGEREEAEIRRQQQDLQEIQAARGRGDIQRVENRATREQQQQEQLNRALIQATNDERFRAVGILNEIIKAQEKINQFNRGEDGLVKDEDLRQLREFQRLRSELSARRDTGSEQEVKFLMQQGDELENQLRLTERRNEELKQQRAALNQLGQDLDRQNRSAASSRRNDVFRFEERSRREGERELANAQTIEQARLAIARRLLDTRNAINQTIERGQKLQERANRLAQDQAKELERATGQAITPRSVERFNINEELRQVANLTDDQINQRAESEARNIFDQRLAEFNRELRAVRVRTQRSLDRERRNSVVGRQFVADEVEVARQRLLAEGALDVTRQNIDSTLQLSRRQEDARQSLNRYSSSVEDFNRRGREQTVLARRIASEQRKLNDQFNRNKLTLDSFGEAAALAAKRFSAFLAPSLLLFGVFSAFRRATTEALEFEAVLTRIEQVLGSSATSTGLSQISEEILAASVATGTSAIDVAQGVQTFAQAGFGRPDTGGIESLANVADQLARIPLAATFGDIDRTAEGLLAIFGQFNLELRDTGDVLDLVNQFAADFATSSEDIFTAVQRGGAAFSTAGGDLEEFVALFSVLRESTRESAETLGTFFKSGIAQFLQPSSQSILEQLGVSTDQGVVAQLRELGSVLEDDRFSEPDRINIARQLTGQRQFARLLALVRELNDVGTQERVDTALTNAAGSFDAAVARRLDDIGTSINRVREAFEEFAKVLIQDESLRGLVSDLSEIASSVLSVSSNLASFAPLAIGAGTAFAAPRVGEIGRSFTDRLLRGGAPRVRRSDISGGSLIPGANPRLERFLDVRARGNLASANLRSDSPLFAQALASQRQDLLQQQIVGQGLTGRRGRLSRIRRVAGRRGLGAGLSFAARDFAVTPGRAATLGGFALGAAGIAGSQLTDDGTAGNRFASGAANVGLAALFGASFGPVTAVIAGVSTALLEFKNEIDRAADSVANLALSDAETPADQLSAVLTAGSNNLATRSTLGQQFSALPDLLFARIESFRLPFVESTNRQIEDLALTLTRGTGSTASIGGVRFDESTVNRIELERSLETNDQRGRVIATILNDAAEDLIRNTVSDLRASGAELDSDQIQSRINARLGIIFSSLIDDVNENIEGDPIQLDLQDSIALVNRAIRDGIVNTSVILSAALESNTFDEPARIVQNAFINLALRFNDILDNQTRNIDSLGGVITDPVGLQAARAPTNRRDLFSAAGLDPLVEFEQQSNLFAEGLSQFLVQNREAIRSFVDVALSDVRESEGRQLTFREIVEGIIPDTEGSGVSEVLQQQRDALVDQFGQIFGQLAAESGVGLNQIISQLVEFDGSLREFVDNLRPGSEQLEQVATALRRDIEVFNRRREIDRQLADSARQASQNVFQLTQQINELGITAEERAAEQQAFATGLDPREQQLGAANRALGRAGQSQFTGQDAFLQSVSDAASALRDANSALQLQREDGGLINRDLFTDLDQAQENLANRQLELSQRLESLGGRIEQAAFATDTFREAIRTTQEQFRQIGSEIRQVTVDDFGRQLSAIEEFGDSISGLTESELSTAAGRDRLDRAFGQLNDQGIEDVVRLLSILGDAEIGGGLTGNEILNAQNENLGIATQARVLRAITGGRVTQGDAEDAIRQALQDLRTQQEQAAALEEQLRQDQIRLVQTQRDLAQQEVQFFEDQRITLARIADSFSGDNIAAIRDTVTQLFASPLPVVIETIASTAPIISPNLTPAETVIPERIPVLPPQISPNQVLPDPAFIPNPALGGAFGGPAIPIDQPNIPLPGQPGGPNVLPDGFPFNVPDLDRVPNVPIPGPGDPGGPNFIPGLPPFDRVPRPEPEITLPNNLIPSIPPTNPFDVPQIPDFPRIPPAVPNPFNPSVPRFPNEPRNPQTIVPNSPSLPTPPSDRRQEGIDAALEFYNRQEEQLSSIIEITNQQLEKLNNLDSISEIVTGLTTANTFLETIANAITGSAEGAGIPQSLQLNAQIDPIQINVALQGDDVVARASEEVYNAVIAQVRVRLAEAFQFDPEARSAIEGL